MSPSDDRSQDPWTDPQTHLDTDPVNAEPSPARPRPRTDDDAVDAGDEGAEEGES